MSTPASPPGDGALLNFVIRMVVPMRREFGRSLDVQQFMRDAHYAREVLDEALTSQDKRLLDYAEYVAKHIGGVRQGAAPAVKAARPPATPSPSAPGAEAKQVPEDPAEPTEAELRARMMLKYTKGVR